MADTNTQNQQQTDPGTQNQQQQQGGNQQNQQQTQTPPTIDYDKIQQMLDGTLAAKEDTALKAYFKQQGLSQQEAEQAMTAFKQQKAANTPDAGALQSQLSQAQAAAIEAQIQNAATLAAVSLGVDVKTIPYVIKMADLSAVMGQDGKINDESLITALNTVLEDVPGLKPQTANRGFTQIGVSSQSGQAQQQTQANNNTIPTKRWNRFNN